MKIELLEYLICPKCRQDLDLLAGYKGDDEDVVEGKLQCKNCQQVFIIQNSIPNLVVDNFD
ncbi:MAG: Trm112 family protein [SAR202 cluster bacterium]|nr:Trm112 family protein [SAR202 cluster bacterium]|tara:strand:- start:41711 stop:41893 length:183 start_codon:yes stop_codon:yes gene_type:complete